MNEMNIAFCINNAYASKAAVVMFSLLENHKDTYINFYIFLLLPNYCRMLIKFYI